MSYQLNKTDGTLLTELIDGQIDQDSTNITLFGKNYTGYGEHLNENFIKILENFSNTSAPSNPLTGQTWWDSSENRLKVYDGSLWKSSGGPYVQTQRPQMVAGDLWINNQTNQVFAYDGTDDILIGPVYTSLQGKSGFETASILDTQSRSRSVLKLFIGNQLVAVYSNLEFTPAVGQQIPELVTDENTNGTIYKGINTVDKSNFVFGGTAESAEGLTAGDGTLIAASQLLRSDADNITVGTFEIQNADGLTIGAAQNNIQKVIGNNFRIENQILNQNLALRVRSGAYSGTIVDAVYIDAQNARVGIFNDSPQYTLDITGDVRLSGNLVLDGVATNVFVNDITVQDKTIELASSSDSTIGDDTLVDGGGIILNSLDGDKSYLWNNSTNSWTSNVNIDLSTSSLAYKINGSTKLTTDSLSNILYADDLVRVGTLQNLDVDNVNINGNVIKAGTRVALGDPADNPTTLQLTGTNGINITGYGDIAVTDNQKITGVANPTSNQDVATKAYTDATVVLETIAMSMDISGLTDPNPPGVGDGPVNNMISYLNLLYPPASTNNGKVARILAVSYTGSSVSGINIQVDEVGSTDANTVLTISKIPVDANGTLNESVVQDIASTNPASGTVTLTPTRYLMVFTSNGVTWTHSSTSSL